ncbi:peptide chain release factor N(5)-glutamine methyltransferase [Sediminivirga luteola]|uniref:Release factor glutamine methyltransferase n=1 Tax=Sediminivirga luteola TaxID=1774748 RepID=A0A8J2TWB7_9MICO|nr:peptide chain release factor N(5)-glutamine methyltransferase [Sediminivirga luteola]GGA07762.1 protein-(glutamine-N5) methyltransferase, release factor-specific [Sediminivirga luteola]
MTGYDAVLAEAARRLAEAGLPSPRADAELLAAHAAGVERGAVRRAALMAEPMPGEVRRRFEELVDERRARIPLQHLTGTAAFRTLTVEVGPGVFVPRPETELIVDLVASLSPEARRIVDLCAGSAALTISLAAELPGTEVYGVELSEQALAWARRNAAANAGRIGAAGSSLHLLAGDALTQDHPGSPLRTALAGAQADAVVSNPPYIAEGQEPLDPEVRDHDPELALYGGGEDGLRIPAGVTRAAAALLVPGGVFICEHGSGQGAAMRVLLGRHGFTGITTHQDLAGRDRFTAGRSAPGASHPSALRTRRAGAGVPTARPAGQGQNQQGRRTPSHE